MTGRWRPGALARASWLAAVTATLLPVQMLAVRIVPGRAGAIPRLYHRLVCRGLGVRRIVRGTPPPPGSGGLIVANHVSWLDIPVLGAERPLAFVAKSEVASWPLIGHLARLQRTVFIDRARRQATAGVAAEMGARLSGGQDIVLFAEGTTGDGTRILPLRSALVGAAHEALGATERDEIAVYPLAITYRGFHGIAGGRAERALLGWYGDTELAPHLKAMFDAGAIDVELTWCEPIPMGRATSRKEATRQAELAIRRAQRAALTGRREDG